MEFLAEEAQELLESDEDFQAIDRNGRQHRYDRQLYLIASDAAAWTQLLGLWDTYQAGERMPRGFANFAHLFSRLRTLRAWDDRDRLERTGALTAWAEDLAGLGSQLVEFEIELWMRRDAQRRAEASVQLRSDLEAARGALITESVHPEIGYHGVLARVPAERLLDAVSRHEVRWMRTGSVRFFHAVGQFATVAASDRTIEPPITAGSPLPGDGEPRIALLDGVPLAGHTTLDGRLILDDPEDWEGLTPANRRLHGTGMASVLVHGDLSTPSRPQQRRIYVRPILTTNAPDWVRDAREELPREQLPVDVIHAAVARLFEGERVAPGVRVIVLAVGDAVAQFDRFVSPMARLIDWLSARYEVLFLVSAGNHPSGIALPADLDLTDAEEVQHEILCALQRARGFRKLLSPAEAVNAVTVGAAHADGTTGSIDGLIDPMLSPDLPSVISAMGSGVRRAVKPEVLLDGGRQLLREEPTTVNGNRNLSVVASTRPPGVRVASPGAPGQLDASTYENGTSPATALAGHHAGHLLEELDALRAQDGDLMAPSEFDAVLIKAALVHNARWGGAAEYVDDAHRAIAGGRSRDGIANLIGYGRAGAASDSLHCDDHRVTALAANRIIDGDAHAYRFPLPECLAATTHHRRLTITLAWLTPVNPAHRAYRRAALKAEPLGMPSRLAERKDVGAHSARRGTLQHEVLEGVRAVPYTEGAAIELVVSCRADAGNLDDAVPYAVIVTLEVAPGLGLRIYEEVQLSLRPPVLVRPRAR